MQSDEVAYEQPSQQSENVHFFGEKSQPDDFLIWSVISTILCLPFGIVALMFSLKLVNSKKQAKVSEQAFVFSKFARNFNIVATVLGSLIAIIMLLIFLFIVVKVIKE